MVYALTGTKIPIDTSHEYAMNITDTAFNDLEPSESDEVSLPAVISTSVFAVAEIVTNGGLLLIFLLRRQTAKHASLIMISTMVNIVISAVFDLAMRIPLVVVKEHNLGKTNRNLCIAMTLAPDFWFYAIILCLPLLSIERLIVLETKSKLYIRKKNGIFIIMLIAAYTVALIIAILPTTAVFRPDVNSKCNGSLLYGHRFAHLFVSITALSVILTAIFSISLVFRLRLKLQHLTTTMRKKIVLKQGTVSAIVITTVLFFALVPFAVSLQLVLMCGSNEITDQQFCEETLMGIIFRVSVTVSRLSLIVLPLIFLGLNPTLRRRIWLTLRRPKQMENIATISSTTGSMAWSKDSGINEGDELEYGQSDDAGDFITIDQDLKFGRSGDQTAGGLVRRQRSVRYRQSVIDLIDVLSVISERSEGADSADSTDSGAYSNCDYQHDIIEYDEGKT